MMNPALKTIDFDFDLPHDRIAQQAVEPRDHARLLSVKGSRLSDHHVFDLPNLLKSGDLLVINDTRVLPSRLHGSRGAMKVEALLHKKISPDEWLAFAKPGKRLRVGDQITFAADFKATLAEKRENGEVLLRFALRDAELLDAIKKYGSPPLPPYIKRDADAALSESERYQTVYARRDGAVAAPTAGLHFTQELFDRLSAKKIDHVSVTLHVGAGTFLPVKVDEIKDHVMHAEWGEVSPEAAARINQAHARGGRIVCVGTTSLRVLESAASEDGQVHAFSGETAIFITPGYKFRAVDALLTNFHLPQSTLFMLVSAFQGLETMRQAYRYAIENGYRFYSYGDASLLEKL